MKTTCPKVADTCWESMTSVSRWFKTNCVDAYTHLESKNPLCKPLTNVSTEGPFIDSSDDAAALENSGEW
eukprot:14083556-Ditylum_brightwellii.AAC.1